MSRVAYVDGAYVPMGMGAVLVEDRGFQFADGVYEVWSLRDGRLLDHGEHMQRLDRSLGELEIAAPMSHAALTAIIRETIRRNHVRDGLVYLQVTRGAAPRDHGFPANASPTVVVTVRPIARAALERRAAVGVRVVTMPDIRWGRCDIKSISLLPNVLAKQAAREAGGYEAWLVDREGLITEGASSTAWIVDAKGRLRTRPLANDILPGITRQRLMDIALERQIPVDEAAFTIAEVKAAREAFMSAASAVAIPVVAIDGASIGDGAPGPVSQLLREAYFTGAGAEARLRPGGRRR